MSNDNGNDIDKRRTGATPSSAARPPATGAEHGVPAAGQSSAADVAAFVRQMKTLARSQPAGTRGRLVFAMDATMSRRPTWDLALGLQSEMFDVVRDVGGLDVQLVYFRGHGECRASKWVSDPQTLARLMRAVDCHGGRTQIGKVLSHVAAETAARKVSAVIYVGDAMEEDVDALCGRAGELGLVGVPLFMFQEGQERGTETAFREMARLTRGAWCRFDAGSARQLRDLLTAVAAYAAGGHAALEKLSQTARGGGAQLLLQQMKR